MFFKITQNLFMDEEEKLSWCYFGIFSKLVFLKDLASIIMKITKINDSKMF